MKELVVISGKGGTGKTSLVAAFAALARKVVLCDADVDAADLHLVVRPELLERHPFAAGHEAVIDSDKCTQCGLCLDWCRFGAINEHFRVEPLLCEGCGVCAHLCPAGAVDFPEKTCGEWFVSRTPYGPMVHARLGIAEENSGKLVSLVRTEARRLAEEEGVERLLTDGPPGVGCPVIASIGNADAVLVVSEPTQSGRHDMERVLELTRHFKVPAAVCINKADLHRAQADRIAEAAVSSGARFVGHIPFDPLVTRAQVDGRSLVDYGETQVMREIERIWEAVCGFAFDGP
ncbi:MinD superfamily P-loop ATPase, contains an inserted ferredoxin domain [Desulfacinum hydrothermale DSM 13146]|uniref:MinD superfamily P-loop ATPase, contains an inserted ferredoxin domain n=1 Tax=Desulfacinum hydrothermale DSM 13146 TaxID=1121390 RepID=A0A1W1WXK7_9BACT|nr:ATP-binding protein [Desulfacinum hydrothermale]SMC16476.1 MinD superfamily P-loop ATPase, contains an inserted ferredoxin domain [Desulfacinum hydrothermale DSM 13146]